MWGQAFLAHEPQGTRHLSFRGQRRARAAASRGAAALRGAAGREARVTWAPWSPPPPTVPEAKTGPGKELSAQNMLDFIPFHRVL